MENKVAILPLDSYDEQKAYTQLSKLLDSIGGIDFMPKGSKVGIKVNLVAGMKPETAVTTHFALVKMLCKILVERGLEVIVGDSPGGPFTAAYVNHIYSVAGMDQVEEVGAQLNKNFKNGVCERFEDAVQLRNFEYTAWLDDVDYIIDFAKLKTHGMMGLSAGVKNLFGAIPGTVKPEYHYRFPNPRAFADMICDLNEYFKPCITIVDGVVGMEGNGPTMGTPRDIGVLVGSRSSYACDIVCAKLIGLPEENVPTIQCAKERGLSPSFDEVELVGEVEPYIISDYKNIDRPNSIEFLGELVGVKSRILASIMKRAMSSRPTVKPKECVGCKKCYNICPAKAITMTKSQKPRIDKNKCIRCFCCQEFCPKGAMKVHRPVIAKILNKI